MSARRLEELERARVRLEALVRAAVMVAGDSTASEAWREAEPFGFSPKVEALVTRATHALAHVITAIDVEKRRAEGRPS